jgi:hypothetical protein
VGEVGAPEHAATRAASKNGPDRPLTSAAIGKIENDEETTTRFDGIPAS